MSKEAEFKVTDRRGEKTQDEAPAPCHDCGCDHAKETTKDKQETASPASEPTIDFSTFMLSMSSSVIIHLGLVEDPVTKKKDKQLDVAKREIDLIEMLAAKTKGNLNPQEDQLMTQILYELRLRYVEASK